MIRKSNRVLHLDVVGSLHAIAVLTVSVLIAFAVVHPAFAQTPTTAAQSLAPIATPSPNLAAPHAPATSPAE
jgi:hypothetical protein